MLLVLTAISMFALLLLVVLGRWTNRISLVYNFWVKFYQNRAKIQELRIIYLSANCETVFVPTLIVLSLSSLVLQGYQPSFKILKQCQLSRGEILFGYGCSNYEHKTVD